MKKILLLSTIVVLLTSAGTISSGNLSKTKVLRVAAPGVPSDVMKTYTDLVTDIMTTHFPANSAWEDSNIGWDKVRQEWHVAGTITQVGGTGRLEILSGRFQNSGEYIEVFYNVYQ